MRPRNHSKHVPLARRFNFALDLLFWLAVTTAIVVVVEFILTK